ncbi:MAG TPA: hypothetical protein VMU93_16630 [Caulobacteraceae bacterium]|nr:hypothetical protein [Caulobacteraceae bacterium]
MRSLAMATVALAALALAACQRRGVSDAAAVMTAVPTTAAPSLPPAPPSMAELAYAPPPQDLPERWPLRLGYAAPASQYGYLDDAYWIDGVYGRAPPDYAFAYDGVGPVVWLDGDYVVCIGEPVLGGERFYYYHPGDDWPYFVQGPQWGYGFGDGVLAAVYDSAGAPQPYDITRARLGLADRYFARGQALQLAARRGDRRQVSVAAWQTDERAFTARRNAWSDTLAHDRAWQAYHAGRLAQETRRWGPQQAWRVAEVDVARAAVARQLAGRAGPERQGASPGALRVASRGPGARTTPMTAAGAARPFALARGAAPRPAQGGPFQRGVEGRAQPRFQRSLAGAGALRERPYAAAGRRGGVAAAIAHGAPVRFARAAPSHRVAARAPAPFRARSAAHFAGRTRYAGPAFAGPAFAGGARRGFTGPAHASAPSRGGSGRGAVHFGGGGPHFSGGAPHGFGGGQAHAVAPHDGGRGKHG